MDGWMGWMNRVTLGWIKREYSRDEFKDSSRDGFGLVLVLVLVLILVFGFGWIGIFVFVYVYVSVCILHCCTVLLL